MLLAIDTSTRYAGVCLRNDQRVLASFSWYSAHNHTRELLPSIRQLLDQAEAGVKDLSAISVALGPGGFSALRVGISTAKGLAFPLGVPLVGVCTLEVEAYQYASTGLPVCALLDAGRGEVAASVYGQTGGGWQSLVEEAVYSPEALVEALKLQGYGSALICGEGVKGREDLLRAGLGGSALVVSPPVAAARVWTLAQIGWERFIAGQVDDVAALQPLYARHPSIGRPREPRSVRY